MATVKLTSAADSDLLEIWQYTDDRWGTEQADTYLRKLDIRMTYLVKNLKQSKIRTEFSGKPLSFHEGRHVIFYRRIKAGIEVIRILHDSMDFSRHLRST